MDQDPFMPPASQPARYGRSGLPFDPTLLPEAPVPPVPPREPVVLRWAPRAGWARAGRVHRTLALGCVPVGLVQTGVTLWALVDRSSGAPTETPQGTGAAGWLLLVSYLLAPPAFYAAARVLRPHVRPGGERAVRHVLSATGTALAVPVATTLLAETVGGTQAVNGLLALLGVPPILVPNNDNQFVVLLVLGVPAFLLGLLTLVWGSAAVVVRVATAGDRPVGTGR